MDDVLKFLQELTGNNSREWFEKNREWYRRSSEKILFLTEVLTNEIRKFDPEIPVINPKDCMFRIFRDVRFSNDKRPYKTNFGSFISKDGRKSEGPGYYFHIEPGQSFAGGGVYMPASGPLKAIRQYIARFPDEFEEITEQPCFKKALPDMYDDRVKTVPKGFSKDHEYMHLLRYKSYVFSTGLTDNDLVDGKYMEKTVEAFRHLSVINAFLSKAIKDVI